MEAVAVIDLETLLGAHGEEVVKEVSVVGECPRNISFPTPLHHGAPWIDFFRD